MREGAKTGPGEARVNAVRGSGIQGPALIETTQSRFRACPVKSSIQQLPFVRGGQGRQPAEAKANPSKGGLENEMREWADF